MKDVSENVRCLACDSTNIHVALDLGTQPLANDYRVTADEAESAYPLAVALCHDCYHLQLSHTVNPDIIYKNYLYATGTNTTIQEYCKWFANFCDEYHKSSTVLDIGCNDGTQLNHFKDLGYVTYGIDPAENLYDRSSKEHTVVCDFFGPNSIDKLTTSQYDIITAQNVMAHNPDPHAFLSMCEQLMSDNTLLFVQTSQANMVANNEFDTIYHEHINYFNINSMNVLAKRAGLHLIDVVKTPIHGTSYIFIYSKTQSKHYSIQNAIGMEASLLQPDTYIKWAENIKNNMNILTSTINSYRNQGYKIIGYGAAAKGNTLLNYIGMKLDMIIDDSPLKQNLFTPGTRIPIIGSHAIAEFTPDDRIVFMPLAWNFFSEISSRIKSIRDEKNDVFLKYFPKVTTV